VSWRTICFNDSMARTPPIMEHARQQANWFGSRREDSSATFSRATWLCGLFIFLCFPWSGLAQNPPHRRVIVLYDGSRDFGSIQAMDQGIETAFSGQVKTNILIFREYMDVTRLDPPDFQETLKEYYKRKYVNDHPDVIIAVRSRSLDFLLKYGDELFAGVPIVSTGMDIRQVQARTLPSRVVVNALRVTYRPTLAIALALKPKTENVAVVLGASPNDQALEALVRDEFAKIAPPMKFTYFAGLPLAELLRKLANLPSKSVILFVSMAQDGTGRSFLPDDAIGRISRAANAPTLVASLDVANSGAVGGDLINFGHLGFEAANIAWRILQGEDGALIPLSEYTNRFKVLDMRALERWNISPGRAPEGTRFIKKFPPGPWEAYKWQILTSIAIVVSQSVLITVLLLSRKRRRAAERALATSEERKHAAVLEERNRLARDIHDSLAQGLTGVIVQIGAAKKAFAQAAAADAHQHIHRAEEAARESLGEARRSIKALRPLALEHGDLRIVIPALMQRMTAGTDVRTEFKIDGEPTAIPPMVEENLLRIQQEMLTNAVKHSKATLITSTLSFFGNNIQLEVQDDGIGFNPSGKYDGYGLIGIRERVHQMSGQLIIKAAPAGGTCLCVLVPTPEEARQAQST
jgi:signal transduction histidine kinase